MKTIYITDKELQDYGNINNFSQKAEALLKHQKEHWNLVKDNFEALNNVEVKKYQFDDFFIKTQFNPSRILSTSAKVDKKSIEKRACFLCGDSLPKVQKGINFNDTYTILCNPYPIFTQHLTIPHHNHIPQLIENSFKDFLELSFELKDNFFVFYNGAKCGASAPDHLHFQAGLKYSLPLENYYQDLIKSKGHIVFVEDSTKIVFVKDHITNFIYIESDSVEKCQSSFSSSMEKLKSVLEIENEPMINLLSFYSDGKWKIFLIPRKVHRPKQYFLENESNILLSPASADIAGLCITPRKEDFNKVTSEDLLDIFNQVSYDNKFFEKLENHFKKN